MQLLKLSDASKDLDFLPQTQWPSSLPAIAWRGYLVTGFERQSGMAVDFDNESPDFFVDLLKSCYPNLGIAEAGRLFRLLTPLGHSALVYKILGWRESEFLKELLLEISTWPRSAQDWCDSRRLAPRDFQILQSFANKSALVSIFELFAERNSGKNHATRILELIGELTLMKIPLPSTPPDDLSWLKALEDLRFPRTRRQDADQIERVNTLPWPRHVQAEWRRRGDTGVLEVQLEAESFESWTRRLDELKRLTDRMQDVWKN